MSVSAERVKSWRKRTKERMVSAMGGKCQCCGYDKCKDALAFHHIDPTEKELGFGGLRANPQNWTKTVQELKKCILVCHNCHSEIHAGARALPSQYSTFNEDYADIKKVLEYDECPVCKKSKETKFKFCSPKCASSNRRKVDWDNIDLLKLLEEHSISEVERMLNISNAAIYKRRDKLLKK